MKHTSPIILLLAAVLFSCGSKNTGIVTTSTPVFSSDSSSDTLHIALTGSILPYGEESSGRVKVKFNGADGYIDREFILPSGKPAVNEEGHFVVYDSLTGNEAHVYYGDIHDPIWVDRSKLDLDTANTSVAAMLDALDSSVKDAETWTYLGKVVASHSTHPMIQTLKIDLSEAPAEEISRIQKKYFLLMNTSKGEIVASKSNTTALVNYYVSDILAMPPDGEGISEYNNPRVKYFYNYICALPKFVKLMSRSYVAKYVASDDSDSLRSYLLYRMDRSPENIKRLYNIFKPVIVDQLSSGLLQDTRPNMKALIAAYNKIITTPNHRTLISNISKKIVQWDKGNVDENGINNGAFTLIDQASIYEPIVDTRKYDPRMNAQGIWYSSFWVRRFGEGNEKVVYDILKELVSVEPSAQNPEDYDADGEHEDESEANETEIITCIFKDYGVGDCAHIEFDCGDYGDADIQELSSEEQALWQDLSIDDETDGAKGNPKYVGQKFSMRVGSTRGPACNEGQGGEGVIPRILEFKLIED